MPEETKVKKKRGWVKNALIIFLAVMLVLTFFSNTIMNRSLPEVAVQMVDQNTINTQIRGSGTINAVQNYEVSIQDARTVQTVNIQEGQEVKTGTCYLHFQQPIPRSLTRHRKPWNSCSSITRKPL